MKKILYYILGFIFLAGCESDLLEKYPVTTINPSIFWQSEQDAVAAVNNLYSFLPNSRNWINRECYADFAVGSNNINDITEGKADATSSAFQSLWEQGYDGIAACNYFLENVDKVTALEPSVVARMKGEARFIRSFFYLNLVMDFGDVPLITKTVTISEGAKVERAPRFDVFDFIISEMDQIAPTLPLRSDYIVKNNELGRVTRGAAQSLKARAALYAGTLAKNFEEGIDSKPYFEKSVSATNAVIASMEYELYGDYSKLFSYEAEYCKEVIFARNYAKDMLPQQFFSLFAPAELSGQGGVWMSITQDLVDHYQMKDNGLTFDASGSGFDATDPYLGRDPRMEASIFFPVYDDDSYASIINGKRWDVRPGLPPDLATADVLDELGSRSTKTGFAIKKYINIEDAGQVDNDGTDLILIRYADVLLMNAEALIELNRDYDVAQARIDEVRLRAGVPSLENSGFSVSDLQNQDVMRSVIHQERSVELALEGLRFFDIRRWKIAEDVIDGPVRGMSYVDYSSGEVVHFTWDIANRIFNPERDYLFPIPTAERQINPNLSQNPEY